jgi:hypothetical protein
MSGRIFSSNRSNRCSFVESTVRNWTSSGLKRPFFRTRSNGELKTQFLTTCSKPMTDGWPTSRSFFARCGIPRLSTGHSLLATGLHVHGHLHPVHPGAEVCGIPHLAKNERDVGHPSLCEEGRTRWSTFVREQSPHQKMQLRLSSGRIEDP